MSNRQQTKYGKHEISVPNVWEKAQILLPKIRQEVAVVHTGVMGDMATDVNIEAYFHDSLNSDGTAHNPNTDFTGKGYILKLNSRPAYVKTTAPSQELWLRSNQVGASVIIVEDTEA